MGPGQGQQTQGLCGEREGLQLQVKTFLLRLGVYLSAQRAGAGDSLDPDQRLGVWAPLFLTCLTDV